MLLAQPGTLQDEGPSVGKGGYCEGAWVTVNSHVLVAQSAGGVKMVVSAASAAVPPCCRMLEDITGVLNPSAQKMAYVLLPFSFCFLF